MPRIAYSFSFLFLVFCLPTYGQINKLTDASSFSPQSILIDFENHADGAAASHLFSQWGIVFSGSDSTLTVIRFAPSGIFIPGVLANVLRNEETLSSLASRPLIINFEFPVTWEMDHKVSRQPSTRLTLWAMLWEQWCRIA